MTNANKSVEKKTYKKRIAITNFSTLPVTIEKINLKDIYTTTDGNVIALSPKGQFFVKSPDDERYMNIGTIPSFFVGYMNDIYKGKVTVENIDEKKAVFFDDIFKKRKIELISQKII